jgi:maltose/maltodextrin transport system permease protein
VKLITWGLRALGVATLLGALALVALLYAAKAGGWAMGLLATTAITAWVYLSARGKAWRWIAPGALAALLFIAFPMLYTLGISFTNYSGEHLLSFERATAELQARTHGDGRSFGFTLEPVDEAHVQVLVEDEAGGRWRSEPLSVRPRASRVSLQPDDVAPLTAPDLKRHLALLPALRQMVAVLPDGTELRLLSLRRLAVLQPTYRLEDANPQAPRLIDTRDGQALTADLPTGFWRHADGTPVAPGFRVLVGSENYARIFTDARFFEPFARVFAWTVGFAGLNTLLTFVIGLLLAVALNWDALRGKAIYRMALFLPYAVPAFISIPVFRGLFNENLGEINALLDLFFSARPHWFSDAGLARTMVLIVNTWLGYPYMMILCMGLIKAVPAELYEASALAGCGPWANLTRITLPLIARPIAPLLVASFAANFNNLTLIALLTEGAPDYLDTQVPVGATDLLASYAWRIAFSDAGQHYALACAIASLVFLIVATLALVNLRLFKVGRAAT